MDQEILEGAKLAIQLYFMLVTQAGLDEQQQQELLNLERERFIKNRQKPLPDV